MHGLAVNLIVSVSGHPWIINEITPTPYVVGHYFFEISFICKSK